MKILLVAHGANHSTYDIYLYYSMAMENAGIELSTFPYHSAMDYHYRAITSINPNIDKDVATSKAVHGASREILTQIVLSQPDHVLFVGGLAVPLHISMSAYNMRNFLVNKYTIGYLFTESPYQDDEQESYMEYADYAFFNDKNSALKYNPKQELFLEYLPHSYLPAVHYQNRIVDNNVKDVVFCGTLYPNRVEMFNQIEWSSINAMIIGNYTDTNIVLNDAVSEKFVSGNLNNVQLSGLYRNSKLSINFHRYAADAYSMNPRIRESVMCGCLPITDYRQEIADVFGDSIPFVSSGEEMSNEIVRMLENTEERVNRLNAARAAIIDDTYEKRLENIVLPSLREVGEIYGKVNGKKL